MVDSLAQLLDVVKLENDKLELSMKLFSIIDVNVFDDSRLRTLFESTWDRLMNLFNMSIDEKILLSVSRAMSHLKSFEEMSKVSEIKVSQLVDDLTEKFEGVFNSVIKYLFVNMQFPFHASLI